MLNAYLYFGSFCGMKNFCGFEVGSVLEGNGTRW